MSVSGRTAGRVVIFSFVVAAWIASITTAAGACEARIELDPAHAWVGEQVIHEIVVTGVASDATIEWLQPPSFPDFRAGILPPLPTTTDSPPGARRQRRALFAARPGELVLPPTPYRCVPASGGPPVDRMTPPAVLIAKAPPVEGRPASWRGLVGPVRVLLEASRPRPKVGETVELVLTIAGPGLVRMAAFEWPASELEAQPPRPELFTTPSRYRELEGKRLTTRRIETLEVVPHAPGALTVPPIDVAYWDPAAEQYAKASTLRVSVPVGPAEPAAASGESAAAQAASAREADGDGAIGSKGRIALALAVSVALVVMWWRMRSRGPL